MKIQIINGPNLNLLGVRETEIYGLQNFESYLETLKIKFPDLELNYFQSNTEGEIINKIQETGFSSHGIILNAAGYSHTSVSIADTIKAVTVPVIEVHISNIYAREGFRQQCLTAANCAGIITGFGLKGYELAVRYLMELP